MHLKVARGWLRRFASQLCFDAGSRLTYVLSVVMSPTLSLVAGESGSTVIVLDLSSFGRHWSAPLPHNFRRSRALIRTGHPSEFLWFTRVQVFLLLVIRLARNTKKFVEALRSLKLKRNLSD